MTGLPTYAVISPVRDEAAHLPRTAQAMLAQTHRPVEWVIVDDGSSDATVEIALALAADHSWIRVITAGAVHRRARGAPIVRAFNAGLTSLRERPEIAVKMDGDLFLPAHYFAWVAGVFGRFPSVGIVGGVSLIDDGVRWRPERANPNTVRGVAKAYRLSCLEDFGGLSASMGWDGIDEYGARARGWEIRVLSELPLLHFRRRGAAQPWHRARWEEGRAAHFMGYRADFLLLRAAYRMLVDQPPLAGGLLIALGFAWARLRGAPQVGDARAVAALRAEQRERLLGVLTRRSSEPTVSPTSDGPAYWATAPGVGADERRSAVQSSA